LRGDDIREGIMQWIWDVIEAAISAHADGDYAENWEWDEMWVALHSVYPVRVPIGEMREQAPSQEELTEIIYNDAVEYYEQREAGWGDELTRNIERWITLNVTDTRWREHLDNMDYMRQGIGLRGYAQKDPLVEYRREGQQMFDEMEFLIEQEVVRGLAYAQVEVERAEEFEQGPARGGGELSYEHAEAQRLE